MGLGQPDHSMGSQPLILRRSQLWTLAIASPAASMSRQASRGENRINPMGIRPGPLQRFNAASAIADAFIANHGDRPTKLQVGPSDPRSYLGFRYNSVSENTELPAGIAPGAATLGHRRVRLGRGGKGCARSGRCFGLPGGSLWGWRVPQRRRNDSRLLLTVLERELWLLP